MLKRISIIVPCYNEEKRITPFLKALLNFSKKLSSYEIIFVNDGSEDNTVGVITGLIKRNKNVRIISLKKNVGKASAVKKGVEKALGGKIIFIDADGSIPPRELTKFISKLDAFEVVVGNRASNKSKLKQSPLRKFIGIVFNSYVNLLFGTGIKDNLCGVKGFRKEVAKKLFRNLISKRWIFDVEIFYKIKKKKYSLCQLPIVWTHKGDSKIKLTDPLKMIFDLLALRRKLKTKE